LRRAVLAGPDGVVEVDDAVLGGVLGSVANAAVITAGLAVAGHVDRRRRVLPGVVTVVGILGLCLFRQESYDLVLARVWAGSRRRVVDGGPPKGQALSGARGRLAAGSMPAVFEQAAAQMPAPGPESYAFGLLVTAFDGTVFDLAATAEIQQEFATPSGGRFPQARMVTPGGVRHPADDEVGVVDAGVDHGAQPVRRPVDLTAVTVAVSLGGGDHLPRVHRRRDDRRGKPAGADADRFLAGSGPGVRQIAAAGGEAGPGAVVRA
jgi:Insertion element 4 transposase N-terminal